MTRINADNLFGLSPFIVDPSDAEGSFTTIQSALNIAVSGDVIFVKGGSYVENLTLTPGVDIIGVDGDGRAAPGTVMVIGAHMLNGNEIVVLENIDFSVAAGNIFTITGGPVFDPVLVVKNCNVASPIGMMAQVIGGGGSPTLILIDSVAVATGIGVSIGGGNFEMDNSSLNSATLEAVSVGASSNVQLVNGSSVFGNTAGITIAPGGTGSSTNSEIIGSTDASVLFTGAGGSFTNISTKMNSGNGTGFYVAGAGSYYFASDYITGLASNIDPATTQSIISWRPFATSGNSGTAVRGTSGFDSTEFTVIDGFVQLVGGPTGITWTDQGAPVVVSANSGSFATAAITLTLPAAAVQGDVCEFKLDAAGPLVVMAQPGDFIRFGSVISVMGGTATTSAQGDAVRFTYRAATTTWLANSIIGNWTIV